MIDRWMAGIIKSALKYAKLHLSAADCQVSRERRGPIGGRRLPSQNDRGKMPLPPEDSTTCLVASIAPRATPLVTKRQSKKISPARQGGGESESRLACSPTGKGGRGDLEFAKKL
jgi:hypothetical protein